MWVLIGSMYGRECLIFLYSTLFRGSVLFQGTAVTCCEGKHGGVCRQEHKVRGCVSGWEEAKKYKSEVGSWENFSWDGPTEGNGGFTRNISYLLKPI